MDKLTRENVFLTFKQRQPLEEEAIIKTAARATESLSKVEKKLKMAKAMGKEERKQDLRQGFTEAVHI